MKRNQISHFHFAALKYRVLPHKLQVIVGSLGHCFRIFIRKKGVTGLCSSFVYYNLTEGM